MLRSHQMKRGVFWVQGFCLLLLLSACNREQAEVARKPDPVSQRYTLRVADIPVQIRIPITEQEQQRGLMGVAEMPENEGMLFPYKAPRRLSFWMANTLIHLDIGFFDADGVLREIHTMYAGDTNTTHSARSDLQYGLEMNAGWFGRNRVRPGARLNLDDLRAALHARGAVTSEYGLE